MAPTDGFNHLKLLLLLLLLLLLVTLSGLLGLVLLLLLLTLLLLLLTLLLILLALLLVSLLLHGLLAVLLGLPGLLAVGLGVVNIVSHEDVVKDGARLHLPDVDTDSGEGVILVQGVVSDVLWVVDELSLPHTLVGRVLNPLSLPH